LLIIVFLLFEPAGLIGLIRRIHVLARRFDARHKGGEFAQTTAAFTPHSQLDIEITRLPRRTDAAPPSE
jgi:hypothetical protein